MSDLVAHRDIDVVRLDLDLPERLGSQGVLWRDNLAEMVTLLEQTFSSETIAVKEARMNTHGYLLWEVPNLGSLHLPCQAMPCQAWVEKTKFDRIPWRPWKTCTVVFRESKGSWKR